MRRALLTVFAVGTLIASLAGALTAAKLAAYSACLVAVLVAAAQLGFRALAFSGTRKPGSHQR